MDKDIVPFLLASFLVLYSVAVNMFTEIELDGSLYIGVGWLVFSGCFYFISKKVYVLAFGVTLIAGLFSLIDFFYMSYKFSLGVFLINPVFIVLILCYVMFCRKELKNLLPK